jgi:hypothetical protein
MLTVLGIWGYWDVGLTGQFAHHPSFSLCAVTEDRAFDAGLGYMPTWLKLHLLYRAVGCSCSSDPHQQQHASLHLREVALQYHPLALRI